MPELYPHQAAGVSWLAERRRALLLDEQGLGKTITAIVAADLVRAERVLVLSPTVVLWNWAAEFRAWSPDRRVQVIENGKTDIDPAADVVITTHGLLLSGWVYTQLLRASWDLLVVDEVHMFRTRSAQRTKILYGTHGHGRDAAVVAHCARVWALTGTPMPNNAAELWTHLWGLFPERIEGATSGIPRSFHSFRARYCQTRETPWGTKVIGNRNLEELREKIDGVTLRRLKADCLQDLPAIRYESVVLNSTASSWGLVADIEDKLRADILAAVENELDPNATAAQSFAALKGQTEFARWRHLCGLAKVAPAAELLAMELEHRGLEKVVVFAHHSLVLAELEKALAEYQPVRITGAVPAKQRRGLVEKFQNDPEVRVALCQIVAGGVGITLTAASDVVFVELSFVPGENAQAADRCHRIGQVERVRVRFVALAGTVDEHVVAALKIKTKMIREVIQ